MRNHLRLLALSMCVVALVATAGFALAQTVAPETAAAAVDAVSSADVLPAESGTAAPVPVGELLGSGLKVVTDWKTVGWMAGLVALCNLLMTLIKRVPFVAALFKKAPPWVQPMVVVVIGAAGGFFSGLATGGILGALTGAVAGVGAGFSAVGADTAVRRVTPTGAAEVEVVRSVRAALTGGDVEAVAAGDAIRSSIADARKLGNPKARMAAAAAILNGKRT